MSTKLYPCCKLTHTAVFAVLELKKAYQIKSDYVKKVMIRVSSFGYNLCGGERKRIPQNVADAQFSYYYTVANALVKGKVGIGDFTERAIRNTRVLAMAKRIEVVVDPEKDRIKIPILFERSRNRDLRWKSV